jgi:hypothetical protein
MSNSWAFIPPDVLNGLMDGDFNNGVSLLASSTPHSSGQLLAPVGTT